MALLSYVRSRGNTKVLKEQLQRHTGIPGLWTQELDSEPWTLNASLWTLKLQNLKLSKALKTMKLYQFIYLFIYSLFKVDRFTIETDIILYTNKNSYV